MIFNYAELRMDQDELNCGSASISVGSSWNVCGSQLSWGLSLQCLLGKETWERDFPGSDHCL